MASKNRFQRKSVEQCFRCPQNAELESSLKLSLGDYVVSTGRQVHRTHVFIVRMRSVLSASWNNAKGGWLILRQTRSPQHHQPCNTI